MTDPGHLQVGVQVGDVLASKYRVERVLGTGGMGVVVAAHHLQLDQKVALKFLLPEALKNAEAVARFDREARAAVRIQSEHVARIIDVGRLETGAPYMVMEYLEGGDLSGWLKQRGPMPVEQAVDFVLQACEAIADAHALGIVHRDLKPANLFCIRRTDGQLSIKVLDFGISKVTTPGLATDVAMTRTSAIIGSPLYMSPEQMQSSKGVDARTDIWSLGVILFELLTARTPFNADAVTELVIKIAVEPAPSVRSLRTDIPAGLEQAIAVCLHKDRDRRYQTVAELAVALKDFGSRRSRVSVERVVETLHAAGMGGGALPPVHASVAPDVVQAGIAPTVASWGQTEVPLPPRSRVGLLVAAVAGVIVLVGGAAVVLMARTPAVAPAPSAAVQAPTVEPQAAPSTVSLAPAPSFTATAPPATTAAAVPAVTAQPAPQPHRVVPAGVPPANAATPPTTPKASCDPPYFIDTAGHRQYKPACL